MANSQNTPRRKKALGRGLGALIPKQASGSDAQKDYFECALDDIIPNPEQPRKHFEPEALADLSASIKESGLIQPLVVRRMPDTPDKYELIAGERRWRASRMAGLSAVPVVVKEVSDAIAFALALIENIQRQELNPVEEAMAYKRLIEEFEFKQAELADQVGKSRSTISNSIRLLNLPQEALDLLAQGQLSSGHARSLLTLKEEEALQLAALILDEQLTVRQTEDRARSLREGIALDDFEPKSSSAPAQQEQEQQVAAPEVLTPEVVPEPVGVAFEAAALRDDDTTRRLVSRLSKTFDAPVQVRDRHGKGRIEIHYDDYAALQRILSRLALDEDFDL